MNIYINIYIHYNIHIFFGGFPLSPTNAPNPTVPPNVWLKVLPLRWKINFVSWPPLKRPPSKRDCAGSLQRMTLIRNSVQLRAKIKGCVCGWTLARLNYCHSHWWPSQGTTEAPLLFLPGLKVSGIFGFVFPEIFVDDWHLWMFMFTVFLGWPMYDTGR